MTCSRTASVLLLLVVAAAFSGCHAKLPVFVVGQGGNGGNGGIVLQQANTNQDGFFNAAKTVQEANANGGKGGDGVNLGKKGKSFPKAFIVAGKGGNGGNGGWVYQKSETVQSGIGNSASTTQTANANGGKGGNGVNVPKCDKKCSKKYPKKIVLVGAGGNGGKGGNVQQYSRTKQTGAGNTASTTQTANANGGNGGNGISG